MYFLKILSVILILFSAPGHAQRDFFYFQWPKNNFPFLIHCSLWEMNTHVVTDIEQKKKLEKQGIPNLNYSIKFPTAYKMELKFGRGILGEQHLSIEIEKKIGSYRIFHLYKDGSGKILEKGEITYGPGSAKLSSYFVKPEGAFVELICQVIYNQAN